MAWLLTAHYVHRGSVHCMWWERACQACGRGVEQVEYLVLFDTTTDRFAKSPSSRDRTSDIKITGVNHYSLALFQLSYRRLEEYEPEEPVNRW